VGVGKLVGPLRRYSLQSRAQVVGTLHDPPHKVGPLLGRQVPGRTREEELFGFVRVEPVKIGGRPSERGNGQVLGEQLLDRAGS
jgi:hypothetical protein